MEGAAAAAFAEEGQQWDPEQYSWDPHGLRAQNNAAADKSGSWAAPSSPTASENGNHAGAVGVSPLIWRDGGQAKSNSSNKFPKGPLVCQVEGCGKDLAHEKGYYQRYRVCEQHLKMMSLMVDGKPSRFCQQCGRFHELKDFDGTKRSCRARLLQHNARRRKRTPAVKGESTKKQYVAAAQSDSSGGEGSLTADQQAMNGLDLSSAAFTEKGKAAALLNEAALGSAYGAHDVGHYDALDSRGALESLGSFFPQTFGVLSNLGQHAGGFGAGQLIPDQLSSLALQLEAPLMLANFNAAQQHALALPDELRERLLAAQTEDARQQQTAVAAAAALNTLNRALMLDQALLEANASAALGVGSRGTKRLSWAEDAPGLDLSYAAAAAAAAVAATSGSRSPFRSDSVNGWQGQPGEPGTSVSLASLGLATGSGFDEASGAVGNLAGFDIARMLMSDAGSQAQYQPDEVMVRVSMKIANCRPEQLPTDMYIKLKALLAAADANLIQGFLRPGCTHLVLDISQPLHSLVRVEDLPPSSWLQLLGEAVTSKHTVLLQCGRYVTLCQPGAAPARLSTAGPVLEHVSPAAVTSDGRTEFLAVGYGLAEPGVKLFLRHQGGYLPVQCSPAEATSYHMQLLSLASCSRDAAVFKISASCPPSSSIGLAVLECEKGNILGNWQPLLLHEDQQVVAELLQLEHSLLSHRLTKPSLNSFLVDYGRTMAGLHPSHALPSPPASLLQPSDAADATTGDHAVLLIDYCCELGLLCAAAELATHAHSQHNGLAAAVPLLPVPTECPAVVNAASSSAPSSSAAASFPNPAAAQQLPPQQRNQQLMQWHRQALQNPRLPYQEDQSAGLTSAPLMAAVLSILSKSPVQLMNWQQTAMQASGIPQMHDVADLVAKLLCFLSACTTTARYAPVGMAVPVHMCV